MQSQKLVAHPLCELENIFGTYAGFNAVKTVAVEERDSQMEFIVVISPAAMSTSADILNVPFAPRNKIPAVEIHIHPSHAVDFVWKSPAPPLSLEVEWSLHGTQEDGAPRDLDPVAGLLGSQGIDGFCHHKGSLPSLPDDISSLRLGFTVQTALTRRTAQ